MRSPTWPTGCSVGWRPADALREFADALDDVTADKVVAALILSASDRGPGLAQALEDLAGRSVRRSPSGAASRPTGPSRVRRCGG